MPVVLNVSGDAVFNNNIQLSSPNMNGPVIQYHNTGIDGRFYQVGSTSTGSSAGTGFSIYDNSGGGSRLLINNVGNVGIGTTNPSYKLDVSGNARFSNTIINGTNGAQILQLSSPNMDGPVIQYHNTGSGGRFYQVGSTSTGSSAGTGFSIYDHTSGGSRLLINNVGNVGIGTTTPQYKLDVNGDVRASTFRGDLSSNDIYINNILQKDNQLVNFKTTLDMNGNNIKNVNDIYVSYIYARNTSTRFFNNVEINANNYIEFGAGITKTDSNAGKIGYNLFDSANNLDIAGAVSSSGMKVKIWNDLTVNGSITCNTLQLPNGVGWGESYNGWLVSINGRNVYSSGQIKGGSLYSEGNITLNSNSADGPVSYYQNTGSGGRTYQVGSTLNSGAGTGFSIYDHTSGGSRLLINNVGNVGIGTTNPNGKLHIKETNGTQAGASQGSILLEHDNNNGYSSIVFKSRTNEYSDYGYIQYQDRVSSAEDSLLTIGVQNDGNDNNRDNIALMPSNYVGIGTTTPQYKLDVNGDVRASTFRGDLNSNDIYINNILQKDNKLVNFKTTLDMNGNNIKNVNDISCDTLYVNKIISKNDDKCFIKFMQNDYNYTNNSSERPTSHDYPCGIYTQGYHFANSNHRNGFLNTYYDNNNWNPTYIISDNRLKHHESNIINSLTVIRKLQPQTYDMTREFYDASFMGTISGEYRHMAGFIAQKIRAIEEISYCCLGEEYDSSGNPTALSIDYNTIFAHGIAATKELDIIIQQQQTEIANLRQDLLTTKEELLLVKNVLNNLLLELGKNQI